MSANNYSMYVHPWDVFDEGAREILEYLSSSNIRTINIAVSYHAGRFILPHNPVRRVFEADEGVIYFNPESRFYENSDLKPTKNELYGKRDVLSELQEAAADHGVSISAWTVVLHNRRLAERHAKLAVVDPYGQRNMNYLCPNRPESRIYATSLGEDILNRTGVDSIQLEAASYPNGLPHGDHHEVFGVPIDGISSYLYSMCYCHYCIEKSDGFGIDLSKLAHAARSEIDKRIGLLKQDKETDLEEALKEIGLSEIMELKRKNTEEHINELSGKLKSSSHGKKVEIVSGGDTYQNEGYDLSHIPKGIDAINLTVYDPDPSIIAEKAKKALSSIGGIKPFKPAVRINNPMITQKGQIRRTVGMLNGLEIAGINFYNYGWTSKLLLDEVSDATK